MYPIIIEVEDFDDEEYYDNQPLGIAYKRYKRVWEGCIEDATELTGLDTGNVSPEEDFRIRQQKRAEYLKQGYEGIVTISKETLPIFFFGRVTSWPELIKILKAFQKSEFKYPIKDAFTFEFKDEDTVVLKLKTITPEIAKKYEKT